MCGIGLPLWFRIHPVHVFLAGSQLGMKEPFSMVSFKGSHSLPRTVPSQHPERLFPTYRTSKCFSCLRTLRGQHLVAETSGAHLPALRGEPLPESSRAGRCAGLSPRKTSVVFFFVFFAGGKVQNR